MIKIWAKNIWVRISNYLFICMSYNISNQNTLWPHLIRSEKKKNSFCLYKNLSPMFCWDRYFCSRSLWSQLPNVLSLPIPLIGTTSRRIYSSVCFLCSAIRGTDPWDLRSGRDKNSLIFHSDVILSAIDTNNFISAYF